MKSFILTLTIILLAPPAYGRTLIDQAGRLVMMPDRPRRVVALAPSITEIVFDIGRGDILVGATSYSNWPEEAKKLPRVGSYVKLDLEKIIALSPDLCLAIKDGNPEYTVTRLTALGVPVYVINPRDLAGIIKVVTSLGNILNAEKKAAATRDMMRRAIKRVRDRVSMTSRRPRVFFQIDAAPIISAGSNTFIDELINIAGGINIAAGPDPYPRFNWEDILRLDPEVVMVASMAGGHRPEELKKDWLRWPQVKAVREKRLQVVDANLIDRPTPRLVEGLAAFARIIHPELYGGALVP